MPFDTQAGPAVLVDNLCDKEELAHRLGVHVNSIYAWIRRIEHTLFPFPVAGQVYDYSEVYEWFQGWVKEHPKFYPTAFDAIFSERPGA